MRFNSGALSRRPGRQGTQLALAGLAVTFALCLAQPARAQSAATVYSPANGSTLSGSTATFYWNAVSGAQYYWLYVGTSWGGSDIYSGLVYGTSQTATNIPTNGKTVYVLLWTYSGSWAYSSSNYVTSAGGGGAASIYNPTNGATLTGSTATFYWNAVGTSYYFYVGTSPGIGDIFANGPFYGTSQTVTTLPRNGNPVYVRLWTYVSSGWLYNDYRYTAAAGGAPLLSIAKSHPGSLTQGQTGASYTVTVTNTGTAASNGTVTVTDSLPSGLTLATMAGTGWSCSGASCSRTDALAISASYPAITVAVNVSGSAAASVTNSATVSGGGSASSSASDVTAINAGNPLSREYIHLGGRTVAIENASQPVPALKIVKSHSGNFSQGQTGAAYTIAVSNTGSAATSGTVTVTDSLPTGLTLTNMTGTGWTCAGASCSRSDALAASASYPAITVTVSVSGSAPASVTNSATASGGGSASATANDTTTIQSAPVSQSISPSSGTGAGTATSPLAFSAVYSDPQGFADINQALIMFSSSSPSQFNSNSSQYGCEIYWNGSVFQLLNDYNTSWTGSLAPNSSGSLSNSQCTLYGSGSTASGSGNTLTITVRVTFSQSAFSGTKYSYLYAANLYGNSGWFSAGSWTVPVAISVSVTPTTVNLSGGQAQQFSASVSGTSSTAVTWSLSPQVGSLSSSGYYASPATIASGQWVYVTATSQADTTKSATASVYLMPPPITLTQFSPNYGSADRQSFTIGVQDSGGGGNLAWIQPFFDYSYGGSGPADSGASGCHILYYPGSNVLYLDGDGGGYNWVGSTYIGGADIANDYCIVHAGSSSRSVSGNYYYLTLDIEFQPWAHGTYKYQYLSAYDNSGNFANWQYFGWWWVP